VRSLNYLLLVSCVLLGGCRRNAGGRPCCEPEDYGPESWNMHPEVIEEAIARANAILADSPVLLAIPGSRLQPRGLTVTVREVHGELEPDSDIASISSGQCIFVNHFWRQEIVPLLTKSRIGNFDLDPMDLLVVILLHEAGHVQKQPLPDTPTIRNVRATLNEAQQEELRADAFAAERIATALKGSVKGGVEASRLMLALSCIGWNLQADRLLNHFGATTLRSPQLFRDPGASHPNLELRFLVINYLITPTPESSSLLKNFLDARTHPRRATLFGSYRLLNRTTH